MKWVRRLKSLPFAGCVEGLRSWELTGIVMAMESVVVGSERLEGIGDIRNRTWELIGMVELVAGYAMY